MCINISTTNLPPQINEKDSFSMLNTLLFDIIVLYT
jgi:hypothetical protein